MSRKYEVLGMGAAIVDILAKVDDSFIAKNNLIKNSMKLIDEQESFDICSQFDESVKTSGGSVANTMAALASLGLDVAFIGKVKDDEMGKIFSEDMSKIGVDFICNMAKSGPATATSIISVTKDAERSMATFLGATRFLSESDIDEQAIKDSKIIYLEGYLWDEENAKKAMLRACKIAKDNSVKVAFSLSDLFCVQRHHNEFLDLIKNNVDIVFSNKDEALALTDESNIDDAINKLKDMCEIAVVTQGNEGSTVIKGNEQYHVNAKSNLKVIDTTGAGDLYAAGFLYALSQNVSIEGCAQIANITASEVIKQMGARLDIDLLQIISEQKAA